MDRFAPEKYRLAILAKHVVQYHSPLYKRIGDSRRIESTVLFLDRMGLEAALDPTMNAVIEWDIPLIEDYSHVFLRNYSFRKHAFLLARFNPSLLWWLRSSRFDGVLIQGYDILSSYLALCAAKLFGLQVIFRGEAVFRGDAQSSGGEPLKSTVIRFFMKMSDAVLYTCGRNREFFLYYGCSADRLYPFPCAVDNGYFRAQHKNLRVAGNPLREKMGIPENLPVVLMVGRMDGRKRQGDLLFATAALQAKGLEFGLIFVGDGPERKELEAVARTKGIRHVFFSGFQNQSMMPAYYDTADFCCLCSSYDPTPKTISEAMNFRLPIIASDRLGTVGDAILEGENALVYPCGDVEVLSRCIEELLCNPERRRQMSDRSYELSNLYTLEADVAGLERAILDLNRSRCQSTSAA